MEKANENEKDFRKGDSGVKYLFRGPRLDWGVLLLKPNDTLGQHYHNEVEETFYLLEGKATMLIDGKEHEVTSGDAFRIEPGERHDVVNRSGSSAKFLFIKTPYRPEDKVAA